MTSTDTKVHFDAVLTPHRSLSRAGFVLLMTAWFLVNAGLGIYFLAHGAWPVVGFFGLDVLILYVAFRINYRSARLIERVRLTQDQLTVVRVSPAGEAHAWSFQPYWLRVSMDDPPRHDSRLTLSSHGRDLAIGSFLTPEERLDLARALRSALARLRGV